MNVPEMLSAIPEKYPTAEIKYHTEDNFSLVLENGWEISFGYGKRHFCNVRFIQSSPHLATTVEIGIFQPDGSWYVTEGMVSLLREGSGVLANQSIEQAFMVIDYISEMRPESRKQDTRSRGGEETIYVEIRERH